MQRVAVLTYNHAALFELACAVELFGLPRPEYSEWYECQVVSFDRNLLEVTAGVVLQAAWVDSLEAFTTLVVPSWPTKDSRVDDKLASEVRAFAHAGKRILSFCSGAFLLAEIGLLDGKKATTHWHNAELFKKRYPAVQYVEDVLYVYDGNVGCSAGSAAALDLGIEIIRNDFGYKIANQVARRLVLSAHRQGGQSQFVETPLLKSPAQFSDALEWALGHLSEPIDIARLAARANMSRRTFDRKFRASFNQSPKAWLISQRVRRARELLEAGVLSIEKIAADCGFESAVTLRHHFRNVLGVSPVQYRKQFSGRVE